MESAIAFRAAPIRLVTFREFLQIAASGFHRHAQQGRHEMRILHLEDDPNDSLFIERSVRCQGIEATFIQVRTANEFHDALKNDDFDIVIVDNSLPGISAPEAIAQAKAGHPATPVIVCSGAARGTDVTAGMKAGATAYVLKDDPSQLANALNAACGR